MRIISGSAGGRRLVAPATTATRPATDRVREAVFSSLGDAVIDARVADLYAGSGAFGLEALSRGAASAVFVENGREAIGALRKNLQSLGLGGDVITKSVRNFLSALSEGFDVVFIDPPWPMPTEDLEEDFRLLDPGVAPGGSVIASRRSSDRMPEPPESWRVATDKRYGDTRIVRYEKENQEV